MDLPLHWAPFLYFAQHIDGAEFTEIEGAGRDLCYTLVYQIAGTSRYGEHGDPIRPGDTVLLEPGTPLILGREASIIRIVFDMVWRPRRYSARGHPTPGINTRPQPTWRELLDRDLGPRVPTSLRNRGRRLAHALQQQVQPANPHTLLRHGLDLARFLLDWLLLESPQPVSPPAAHVSYNLCTRAEDLALARIQSKVSIGEIAEALEVSQRTLERVYKRYRGHTLKAFLQEHRLQEAKQLLQTTDLTLEQIAERVGYAHVESLRGCFKSLEGLAPRAWLAQHGS